MTPIGIEMCPSPLGGYHWDVVYDWLLDHMPADALMSPQFVANGIAHVLRRCGVAGAAVELYRLQETRQWSVRIELPDRRVIQTHESDPRVAIGEACRAACVAWAVPSPTVPYNERQRLAPIVVAGVVKSLEIYGVRGANVEARHELMTDEWVVRVGVKGMVAEFRDVDPRRAALQAVEGMRPRRGYMRTWPVSPTVGQQGENIA